MNQQMPIPDYVPEEKMTTGFRVMANPGGFRDYVPGKGHELRQPASPEAAMEQSARAAKYRMIAGPQKQFEDYSNRLRGAKPHEAKPWLDALSEQQLDVALAAEVLGNNRSAILDAYPGRPNQATLERCRAYQPTGELDAVFIDPEPDAATEPDSPPTEAAPEQGEAT